MHISAMEMGKVFTYLSQRPYPHKQFKFVRLSFQKLAQLQKNNCASFPTFINNGSHKTHTQNKDVPVCFINQPLHRNQVFQFRQ